MTKAQEPDWKALVLEHNADCDSRCDMDACGYKEHFEFSNRRCPTCPVKQKIDVNYATQPTQEPVALECTYGYSQCQALAVAQQKRPWVGLTDEEIDKIRNTPMSVEGGVGFSIYSYARAIEAKLKDKNT